MSDEPPIRVRNGSMRIELINGEWMGSDNAWTPKNGKSKPGFVVVVERATLVGTTVERPVYGTRVDVTYSDGKVVKFRHHRGSGKTKVTPKGILTRAKPWLLVYGTAGTGCIASVQVKNAGALRRFGFQQARSLVSVLIYPMPS